MRKITIVAAALALPSLAAQADVTIYGSIDETLESVSAKGATDSSKNVPRTNRINSNSSLIGFKGGEDLGDGIKVLWQIESGVGIDTGGGTFATRDSFVGLAAPTGTMQLGFLTSPTRAIGGIFDVNKGATGIGMTGALLGKLGNLALTDPALKAQSLVGPGNGSGNTQGQIGLFDNRTRNAVQYTTPVFNHLSASAMYASGEKATGPSAYTANVGLKYDNGALYSALGYSRFVTGAEDSASLTQSAFRRVNNLRVAAFYRFSSNTRVGALYDWTDADLTNAGAALNGGKSLDQTVWYLNGTLGITTNGRLIAQYGQAGKLKGGSDSVAATGKAKHYELGYEHDLSKQTLLKVVYSEIRNDNSAKYDFGIGSIGGIGEGANPRGFAVGLRHSF